MKFKQNALIVLLVCSIGFADSNITAPKKTQRLSLVPYTSTLESNTTKPIVKNLDSNSTIAKKKKTTGTIDDFRDYSVIKIKEKSQKTTLPAKLPSFDNLKLDSYQSTYKIQEGDTIGAIARRFNVAQSEIIAINPTLKNAKLKIGKDIFMPVDQDVIDSISSEQYTIKHGDTLDKIAKKLKIKTSELKNSNKDKLNDKFKIGESIVVPLPSSTNKLKIQKQDEDEETVIIKEYKKQLRVTASAYTSHVNQTSANPFLGAWGHRLVPGEKSIAVSRDLITEHGLTDGKKVKIGGLDGEYTVRDKMNKRYTKHIDIYMGLDRNRALRWGRRSAMISW